MSLLRLDQVSLVRGGRPLFEGLSVALGAGEALHVRGPNGVGKSSLLRLAAGLLDPASGHVQRTAAALSDGHVALDRERTLRDALLFWARLGGVSGAVDEALEALGIAHLGDVPVRLLSTGQTKRASIARVLASRARLWLLDEPLNGLDADGAERLHAALARHRDDGGGVIAASHHPLPGQWRYLDLAS